jgi:hypothetical protein
MSVPSDKTDRIPIDDGYDPSVTPISVWQDAVVHPSVFEAFHDRERRAWEDRFGRAGWRSVVNGHRDLFC